MHTGLSMINKKSKMKNIFLAILSLMVFSFSTTAQTSEIFAPAGIAINGYDAVAFFKDSKSVKGLSDFSYTWKNVQWHFSSKSNLETFKTSPEKFAPQFGGYCAYGTAKGYKAPTQIDTWTIVQDKLYFNYNQKVKLYWDKNQAAFIDSADVKWPFIKNDKL